MLETNEPPDDVLEAVKLVKRLKEKTYLSRDEKIDINRAKLRVAYWACRSESVVASRQNLEYVLGEDAAEIMKAYDKYLESPKPQPEKKGARKTPKDDGTAFWGRA